MRLFGLDALRGIAALMVVLVHINLYTNDLPIFSRGWLAVDFFFMLSGYVMARTYESRLRNDVMSPLNFAAKRISRIWPTVAVGAILGFVNLPSISLLLAGLLLVPVFAGTNIYPINGVLWSLFFELFANFLHGIFFARFSIRALGWLALACGIATLSFAAYYGRYHLGYSPETFIAGFPRSMMPYIVGIILFRTWEDDPPIKVPAAIVLAVMPVSVVILSEIEFWVADMFFVLLCPILIAGGLMMRPHRSLVFLGVISYPLYVTHTPIMRFLYGNGVHPAIGAIVAICAVAIAVARPWQRLFPAKDLVWVGVQNDDRSPRSDEN